MSMTLRDVFDTMWNIWELDITVRDFDGHYLHEWIIEEKPFITAHYKEEVEKGRMTIIGMKINAHGKPTRSGSEMGWGVEEKLFPKELLDAPISFAHIRNINSEHDHLRADVYMHPMTVEKIKGELK